MWSSFDKLTAALSSAGKLESLRAIGVNPHHSASSAVRRTFSLSADSESVSRRHSSNNINAPSNQQSPVVTGIRRLTASWRAPEEDGNGEGGMGVHMIAQATSVQEEDGAPFNKNGFTHKPFARTRSSSQSFEEGGDSVEEAISGFVAFASSECESQSLSPVQAQGKPFLNSDNNKNTTGVNEHSAELIRERQSGNPLFPFDRPVDSMDEPPHLNKQGDEHTHPPTLEAAHLQSASTSSDPKSNRTPVLRNVPFDQASTAQTLRTISEDFSSLSDGKGRPEGPPGGAIQIATTPTSNTTSGSYDNGSYHSTTITMAQSPPISLAGHRSMSADLLSDPSSHSSSSNSAIKTALLSSTTATPMATSDRAGALLHRPRVPSIPNGGTRNSSVDDSDPTNSGVHSLEATASMASFKSRNTSTPTYSLGRVSIPSRPYSLFAQSALRGNQPQYTNNIHNNNNSNLGGEPPTPLLSGQPPPVLAGRLRALPAHGQLGQPLSTPPHYPPPPVQHRFHSWSQGSPVADTAPQAPPRGRHSMPTSECNNRPSTSHRATVLGSTGNVGLGIGEAEEEAARRLETAAAAGAVGVYSGNVHSPPTPIYSALRRLPPYH